MQMPFLVENRRDLSSSLKMNDSVLYLKHRVNFMKGGRVMETMRRLGLAAGMLAVALLLGGCVWLGLDIGKSSTPATAYVDQTIEGQMNDLSE